MFRRLLTAGLTLSALLASLACAGRAAAKAPELPVVDQDVVAPQSPLAPVEATTAAPNPFPPAAAPAAPALYEPPFFRMRPSARRMMASCLLFGVHPLLGLAPTDEYVDFDDDYDPNRRMVELLEQSEDLRHTADEWERYWNINQPPAEEDMQTGTLINGVGVNGDIGLTGSIEKASPIAGALGCGEMLKSCMHLIPHVAEEEEQSTGCTGFHVESREGAAGEGSSPVEPMHEAPAPTGDAAQSVCPYMNERCAPDRRAVLYGDLDLSRDVLQHLEMLREARALLDTARDFARAGRMLDALECLGLAHDVCPGGRIDEAVQAAAAELFPPYAWASQSANRGGEEASEVRQAAFEDGEGSEGECVLTLCTAKSEQESEVEQKLAFPVSVSFHDAPLREVIDDLRSWQGMNIVVDKAALEAAKISLNRPVSIEIENVRLKSALNLILQDAHLTYVVKDDVLQITTEQAAGKRGRVPMQGEDTMTPCLPPVDPHTPAALDQLYPESSPCTPSGGEEQEAPAAPPKETSPAPQGSFELGLGLDGSVQMFGQLHRGGAIWHAILGNGGLSVWSAPDGGADPAPEPKTTPEGDSGD